MGDYYSGYYCTENDKRDIVTKRDYYEILGVDRGAEEGAVKSAYRKKAMQYHPDRNPGNSEAEDKTENTRRKLFLIMLEV